MTEDDSPLARARRAAQRAARSVQQGAGALAEAAQRAGPTPEALRALREAAERGASRAAEELERARERAADPATRAAVEQAARAGLERAGAELERARALASDPLARAALEQAAREGVSRASEGLDRAQGELARAARDASEELRRSASQTAEGVRRGAEDATRIARAVLDHLDRAADRADDAEAMCGHLEALLAQLGGQLDREADVVAIGRISEVGPGLAAVRGLELQYARGPRRLRALSLEGKAARLALGGSTGAYVLCLYGPPEATQHTGRRRGVDAGVMVAALGLLRVRDAVTRVEARGWMAALSAGVDIGVPILGDISAFEVEEQLLGRHVLDEGRAERLERALREAPDRAVRRRLANLL